MSAPRVVVTDATFPDLSRERAAAERHGARFAAFQCRSAAEVAEALRAGRIAGAAGGGVP